MLEQITRRKVQIALGVLWLLDGALQLQHQMFTANFANDVIAPAAQGQPRFIASVMHFFVHIFLRSPVVCNSFIALIQLGLGALILWKRTAKFGLVASVFWGLFVWYVGEGLGGLFTAQTSLLMGAPGAALIYVVIALGVMPPQKGKGQHPAFWLAFAWAILWLGGGVLQLMNGQNTSADLSTMIRGMAGGAPGWLATVDTHVANLVQSFNWIIVALVIGQALIGFGALLKRRWRMIAIFAGIILSLAFWIVGQGLGSYYSGLATDPNTAPLVILLGLAVLGTKELDLAIL